jgi:hypothetical protein
MRLVVFCEAAADFQIASTLVDRVLRTAAPSWVVDVLDTAPESILSWHGDGQGRAYFDVHSLTKYVDELRIRVPHGHFDGRPGAADAMMARTALAIARHLVKHGHAIDAALLVRDMDDQPERATGLEQARAEARTWSAFQIVLGCADPMREAWVLCGFEPESDEERSRLDDLRQDLGFHPHEHAHQLTAKDEQARRSAKRVLRVLTADDRDREARCWTHAPLDVLRARGEPTGLRAYLLEIEQLLVPLVTRG